MNAVKACNRVYFTTLTELITTLPQAEHGFLKQRLRYINQIGEKDQLLYKYNEFVSIVTGVKAGVEQIWC